MSTDLTFLTNEPGKTLADRFDNLLKNDTRFFDCLVGYFFISGFHKLHTSLENSKGFILRRSGQGQEGRIQA